MQTRLGISGVVLVLSAGVSVQTATACPRKLSQLQWTGGPRS